jgi:hypothetical protein
MMVQVWGCYSSGLQGRHHRHFLGAFSSEWDKDVAAETVHTVQYSSIRTGKSTDGVSGKKLPAGGAERSAGARPCCR